MTGTLFAHARRIILASVMPITVLCGLAVFSSLANAQVAGTAPRFNNAAPVQCQPLQVYDFAFTSKASGNSDIWLYRAEDASIVPLTVDPSQDHWATWSPRGKELGFQTLRDGNREVYIQEMHSGEQRNLSQHDEQDQVPAWSPDGSWLAFASSRDKPWPGNGPLGGHIFLVHPDGTGLHRLNTGDFYSTSGIIWAPDSGSIAYARFGEGKQGLYSFDLESGTESPLLVIEGESPGIVAYSPSGNEIVYYLDYAGGADLYLLSLADHSTRRITSGGGYHYYASWSPDGSALLTTTSRDPDGGVYSIHCTALDGSYDVPVIEGPADSRNAAWRPVSMLEDPALRHSVEELRLSRGEWQVQTDFLNENGSIARTVFGTYEFTWVVEDRVLLGQNHIHELEQASGILFYIDEKDQQIEMSAVGEDGLLWIMNGPLGSDVRWSQEYPTTEGGVGQLRFTRFNIKPDEFESRMEYTEDGGKTWKPGNHQLFTRMITTGRAKGSNLDPEDG